MQRCIRSAFLFAFLVTTGAHAFNDAVDSAGPLTARIEGPSEITRTEVPLPLRVVLTNGGGERLSGTVTLGVIDGFAASPSGAVPFSIDAGTEVALPYTLTVGSGTFNAHYPIHAYVDFAFNAQPMQAHPILIVEPHLALSAVARHEVEWGPFEVSDGTETPLWRLPAFRALLAPEGAGQGRVLPPGWQGIDEETRGCLYFGRSVDRGGARESITMHPPWQSDTFSSVAVEYPVKLPPAQPIRLRFANAIRDHFPERGEPASDGVTFRVRVVPFGAPDGAVGEVLFERHTDAKTWLDGEADLSAYSGQAVRIQLEAHPGPQRNTACDECYWAEPALVAGAPKARVSSPDTSPRPLGTIDRNGARYTVDYVPGERGLLDATVRISDLAKGSTLSFQGFPVRIQGDDVSDPRSLARLMSAREEGDRVPGRVRMRHRFTAPSGSFDVLVEMCAGRESLQVRFWLDKTPAPKPWQACYIEDLAAGPWNAKVRRVYAGTGNVIEDPEAFRLEADGHRLSTSFVGFEFDNGQTLVQAVDVPPSSLEVTPGRRAYSLHAAHAATLTFVPASTVWEGARAWHDINGLTAAPGVPKLAGRFVFDLWGGQYAASADALTRAFRYGLVDSTVVWHAWQRWGYDYRLPDIFPPNPKQGTLEEFQRLAEVCRQNGVLFAPHDNYIDYYPDADGFSYDKISFSQDGQPVRGWLNESTGAQAYRWRMDAVEPSLRRNLRLIKDSIAPTAYFIDVWSSIQPYDYWTRDGRFFDRVYTRDEIGRQFDWIRDFLGDGAPQISESGEDQLVGTLDGAQANHLRVWRPGDPDGAWTVWKFGCRDAERVPWFDAAHHDRFVLHGAGYEPRYPGGLDVAEHGIYSDDYLSTEVLTGHPVMVKEPFSRDAIRKYWLLHDLMRGLALDRIQTVEFVDNIHRQHVVWQGGEAWVNRGGDDWSVGGRVLPPFGFYARAAQCEAAIERRGEAVVEWSSSPESRYVNARSATLQGAGALATDGACRLTRDGDALRVTLLPESKASTVRIRWNDLPWTLPQPARVERLAEDGAVQADQPVAVTGGIIELSCAPGDFAYRISAP